METHIRDQTQFHAFTITLTNPCPSKRLLICRLLTDSSFLALANEKHPTKSSYVLKGIVWLHRPCSLSWFRIRLPSYVQIHVQVSDMIDYKAYFLEKIWFDKPVQLQDIMIRGEWPENEAFWQQRPAPDGDSDAALCYYDVRKTALTYTELVQKYFSFWCKYPYYIQTCFLMFRPTCTPTTPLIVL